MRGSYLVLACPVVIAAVLWQTANGSEPPDQSPRSPVARFLKEGWGFDCQFRHGEQVVVGVRAFRAHRQAARDFIGSLGQLRRLVIEGSVFKPGDVRSLAQSCPLLTSLHLEGSARADEESLGAELCSELLEFKHLTTLSLECLRFSAHEQCVGRATKDLDTLRVSGNLAGKVSILLARFRPSELGLKFHEKDPYLTPDDLDALNDQTQIRSLAIMGHRFGSRVELNLRAIRRLGELRQLLLDKCEINPAHLALFPNLETLTLKACALPANSFNAVLALPRLRRLTLCQCNNAELGVRGPCKVECPHLEVIVFQLPVLTDLHTFEDLPVDVEVEVGNSYVDTSGCERAAMCMENICRQIGEPEATCLERIRGLRSVTVRGLTNGPMIREAALLRLSRLTTIRTLRVIGGDIEVDAEPLPQYLPSPMLQELALCTAEPLTEDYIGMFLGATTRSVSVNAFSPRTQGRGEDAGRNYVAPKDLKSVGLRYFGLPIPGAGLADSFLTRSLDELTLDECVFKDEAVRQVVDRCPSLKRLSLRECSFTDERQLLLLNLLKDLDFVDLTDSRVSAEVALTLRARTLRFGTELRWDQQSTGEQKASIGKGRARKGAPEKVTVTKFGDPGHSRKERLPPLSGRSTRAP